MSYDRSPRAVCSTTIGTKFNALVSKYLLLDRPRLRAHEILEAHAPSSCRFAARQQEIDNLILEHRRFDLSHHATIAAIELRGFLGFLVRRRQLLDALLDARLIELDLVLAQRALGSRARSSRAAARWPRNARAAGAWLASLLPIWRKASACSAVDFLVDERPRHGDPVGGDQRVEHARFRLRSQPLLELALHVVAHFAAKSAGAAGETEARRRTRRRAAGVAAPRPSARRWRTRPSCRPGSSSGSPAGTARSPSCSRRLHCRAAPDRSPGALGPSRRRSRCSCPCPPSNDWPSIVPAKSTVTRSPSATCAPPFSRSRVARAASRSWRRGRRSSNVDTRHLDREVARAASA